LPLSSGCTFHAHMGNGSSYGLPLTPDSTYRHDEAITDDESVAQFNHDVFVVSQWGLAIATPSGESGYILSGHSFTEWFEKLKEYCERFK
jgi:hypothetical protein